MNKINMFLNVGTNLFYTFVYTTWADSISPSDLSEYFFSENKNITHLHLHSMHIQPYTL